MARCLLCPFPRPLQRFKSFRNCYLARFQHPLQPSKASKPFLLGFETVLWHFRSATSFFYWASKLLSGTFSAPQPFHGPFKASKASEAAIWQGFQHPLKPSKASKPFLLGFETALWHFRSATSFFYWASKLLSGTFSAPLKTLKTLKTLAAAFDGLALLCHMLSGTFSAPLKTLKGLKTLPACSFRRPFAALPWPHELFLLGFETAISNTSEAPQAVSIGLQNCYLARFQHPLKASKPSKPSQQLSMAFRCFAMRRPEAPRAVSVGLRNCYLALPKRHKLFLLGFETAIWHVFSTP